MKENNILENLNKRQLEAVLHKSGPLAIIAGAGSGKTRTIVHKIAHMIKSGAVETTKILAVTFTNKAAKEMKTRVKELIGDVEGDKVNIVTFHSLCAKILRVDAESVGYSRHFSILDNLDQQQILKLGYAKYNLSAKTLTYASTIDYISKKKNSGISIEELREHAHSDTENAYINLYEFYLNEIKGDGTSLVRAMDFDDLLLLVNKLFKEHPAIRRKWSHVFDYILVDEFQDTSTIQFEIIKYLSPHNNVTVVGDPDQTIYTWRLADPKLILEFKKNYKGSKVVMLEQNYRSTSKVLDAANRLIVNNKNRLKKNLFTDNEGGDEIDFFYGFSEQAEARWVIQKINELRKMKTQFKDIAILFRANYLSNTIEKELIDENINYVIFGGIRFYQRQEIKDVIAFLKVINNGDKTSLKRIINVPARKIGAATQEKIFNFLKHQKGKNVFEKMVSNFDGLPVPPATKKNLADFVNKVRKYRVALKTNKLSNVVEKFLNVIGYTEYLFNLEDKQKFDNITELIDSIKTWEFDNQDKSLQDFLSDIALYTDKQDEFISPNFISLMTVHTSKGLEFDNVFLFGFSEGVFPSRRALNEGGGEALEEERRLAYVATTRAKKRLFVSSSRGFSSDNQEPKKPSRFVKEMGIDLSRHANEFLSPTSVSENYEEERKLIEGDEVVHEKFGTGVVVNIDGQIAEISFKSPFGVKAIMKNHKSIVKAGR